MKSIRSLVHPVAVALVLAISAAPLTAFAGDRAPVTETKKAPQFPMTAESFNKHIEARITRMREHLTKALAAHKVPEAKQAEIKKQFETNAAAVKAAAAKAGADGTVTKDEAKEVRGVAKNLRHGMRGKHHGGKGKRHEKKNDNVG